MRALRIKSIFGFCPWEVFMLRYLLALSAISMLLPAIARAEFKQSDWELTLSGSGNNDKDFRTGSASADFTLAYFLTDQIEAGVRQGLVWSDGGSSWSGDTRLAADYNFDLGRWVPFAGVNGGYEYGPDLRDQWIAGPEAGLKFFLNSTTFVQANVAYEFSLNDGLDSGAFFYGLGLGVRL
jgi:hypothetical protein